ncbi:adhesin [Pseudomonas aeruginosa]|uniref:adhesin n=1 Tax=Pseudomonas aeruginosa TaxID=287 RepID=UPI00313B80EE
MKRLSALLLAFACIASLQADPLASRNRASIDDSGTYRGNFALNQAAGDAQQQSNVRVVAVGSAALVGSDQRQHLQLDASQPIAASASISGAALRGSGILGVNQGAGLGNQQINAFRLSLSNGPESLDDSALAQSVALTKVSGSATPVPGGRSVSTDDRAFAGSSGVVQVNQSAGVGNQSMNTLSVRVME